jgi:hypothetical protein
LIVDSEWYSNHHISDNPAAREPSIDEIRCACKESMKRNEWELVREFLKRQDEDISLPVVQARLEDGNVVGDGMDVDIKLSPVALAEPSDQIQSIASTSLDSFRAALAEHDQKNLAKIQKQQKARAKDDWAHKNMGLVMYPIDAVVDVATAMIPRSWLGRRHSSEKDAHVIVSAMS